LVLLRLLLQEVCLPVVLWLVVPLLLAVLRVVLLLLWAVLGVRLLEAQIFLLLEEPWLLVIIWLFLVGSY
jgi:hypothetical protein